MRLRSLWLVFLPVLALAAPDPIAIGERFKMESAVLGETRTIFVHRPADYDLSTARYPVLIVLDGGDDFRHASTTADFLADAGRIPQMLVVGIPNTDRDRDLIPVARGSGGNAPSATRGGADRFLEFITKELLPRLDRDYRTQTYRILVGHSNGGLFALHALTAAPGVFKGFVLASPALGVEDAQLLREFGQFLDDRKDLSASVYLATANESDLLSGNWELSSRLQARAARDTHWTFAYRNHPEESHGTITLRAVYDGLGFIYDGWSVPDAFALYEKGGQAAIEKHYADLSARFGVTIPVPPGVLLAPVYPLYRARRTEEAERVILRDLELYPDHLSGLLTAGRLYYDRGDMEKARDYLTKALQVSPLSRALGVKYENIPLDPEKVVPAVKLPVSELNKSVGSYGLTVPAVEIVQREGKLFVLLADREQELTALSASRFYFNSREDVITFRRDDRGRVTGLRLENRGVELAKLKPQGR